MDEEDSDTRHHLHVGASAQDSDWSTERKVSRQKA
jgi:hypothetical protein